MIKTKHNGYSPDGLRQPGLEAIGNALIGSLISTVVSSIFSPSQKSQPQQQQSVYTPPPAPAPVVAQPVVPMSNADDRAKAQQAGILKQYAGYTSAMDTKSMSKQNRVNTALGGGVGGIA